LSGSACCQGVTHLKFTWLHVSLCYYYCCYAGLKLVGTEGVLLSPSQDLPLLASRLPLLQQLHFAGGFTQLSQARLPMQVSG
jgi:hypothetical protein